MYGYTASRCDFFKKDGRLSKLAVIWKHRMAKLGDEGLAMPLEERVDPIMATAVNTQASSTTNVKVQQVDDAEWEARMAKAQGRAGRLKSKPSTRKWAEIDSNFLDSDPSDSENKTLSKGKDNQHYPSA